MSRVVDDANSARTVRNLPGRFIDKRFYHYDGINSTNVFSVESKCRSYVEF